MEGLNVFRVVYTDVHDYNALNVITNRIDEFMQEKDDYKIMMHIFKYGVMYAHVFLNDEYFSTFDTSQMFMS